MPKTDTSPPAHNFPTPSYKFPFLPIKLVDLVDNQNNEKGESNEERGRVLKALVREEARQKELEGVEVARQEEKEGVEQEEESDEELGEGVAVSPITCEVEKGIVIIPINEGFEKGKLLHVITISD